MTAPVDFAVPDDLLRAAVAPAAVDDHGGAIVRDPPTERVILGALFLAGLAAGIPLYGLRFVLLVPAAIILLRNQRASLSRLTRNATLSLLTRAMALSVAAEIMISSAGPKFLAADRHLSSGNRTVLVSTAAAALLGSVLILGRVAGARFTGSART